MILKIRPDRNKYNNQSGQINKPVNYRINIKTSELKKKKGGGEGVKRPKMI